MRILTTLIIFTISFQISAQGIEFYKGDWKDALVKAKEERKLVFVDAYAKWCGPCKRMAKTVFTQEEVGTYFNKNFINLKIDMEEGHGLTFRDKYPVSAYPTLFILDGDGEIVQKTVGGKKVQDLITFAQDANSTYDFSGDFAERYENGDRSFELVYEYVKELNRVGKPSLKIANAYLKSSPEISSEQMADFLMISTVETDSKIFDAFVENKKNILKKYSKSEYYKVAEEACLNTVEKAIEFDYLDLMVDAKKQLKKASPSKTGEIKADLHYQKLMGNYNEWASLTKKYIKKSEKDVNLYKALISDVNTYFSDNADEHLYDWYPSLVKLDPLEPNYIKYASFLVENKDYNKAIEVLQDCKKVLSEEDKKTDHLDQMIKQVEQKI